MNLRFLRQSVFSLSVVLAACAASARAEPPLHRQIDALIEAGQSPLEKTTSAEVDDAGFLRRAYLDLTGTIPSIATVRQFLADPSPDKRARLVDRLLASPRHARRMQYVFDAMLMERRADKHVPSDQWRDYLRQSFLQDKPWDQLVREMLTADGTDEKSRGPAKFLLEREMKIDEVTRDLGRMFLGRDMQCAQCHDHPNVDDYLQRHYHGLAAFLKRSYLFTDPKTKKTSIGEKANGVVSFTSVFTSQTDKTAPRMLDLPAIDDPTLEGDPYKVKPAKNVRSVPVYSRRLQLAAAMTQQNNVAFKRNIANRLWALMMGRGIVEPVDMWHAGNPPSHGELLDLLADSLQSHGYDMRYLLRELALSKTYQRSSLSDEGVAAAGDQSYAHALLKPLSAEQLAWSTMQAVGLTDQMLASLQAKQIKAAAEKDDAAQLTAQVDDPLWQEEALHAALQENVKTFVAVFGVVGSQTSRFDASAEQALFLRNGSLLQSWAAAKDQNLTSRLAALETADQIAQELYLSVFSRLPRQQENDAIAQFLEDDFLKNSGDDRLAALKDLVWAALSSAEFRFNH